MPEEPRERYHDPRERYHAMLDQAMDATREGDFFLPQFVRLLLLDWGEAHLEMKREAEYLRRFAKEP